MNLPSLEKGEAGLEIGRWVWKMIFPSQNWLKTTLPGCRVSVKAPVVSPGWPTLGDIVVGTQVGGQGLLQHRLEM